MPKPIMSPSDIENAMEKQAGRRAKLAASGVPAPKKPEPASAEAGVEIEEGAILENEEDIIQNENEAVNSIADNLSLIQKHLFAMLYLAHTWRPEITGVTYVHEVFQAIYTGDDPFKEVDDMLERLKTEGEQSPKKNAE